MFAVGAVEVVGRIKEIKLYERLNEQLSNENSLLKNLLIEANDKNTELKAQLDEQLGLTVRAQSTSEEDFKPIGGYESPGKKANRLSILSFNKAVSNESQRANELTDSAKEN